MPPLFHSPSLSDRPQFFVRTADVTGSVQLPEGTEMVMPGDTVSLTIDVSMFLVVFRLVVVAGVTSAAEADERASAVCSGGRQSTQSSMVAPRHLSVERCAFLATFFPYCPGCRKK